MDPTSLLNPLQWMLNSIITERNFHLLYCKLCVTRIYIFLMFIVDGLGTMVWIVTSHTLKVSVISVSVCCDEAYLMNINSCFSTGTFIIPPLFPTIDLGNKSITIWSNVDLVIQLLIFIRYASSQQTLTEITDTFSVCEVTIHTIVHRTLSIICSEMLPDLIK
jgi:hypothetical protein